MFFPVSVSLSFRFSLFSVLVFLIVNDFFIFSLFVFVITEPVIIIINVVIEHFVGIFLINSLGFAFSFSLTKITLVESDLRTRDSMNTAINIYMHYVKRRRRCDIEVWPSSYREENVDKIRGALGRGRRGRRTPFLSSKGGRVPAKGPVSYIMV